MSTTTNHKRTRIIALVTALLVVAGVIGLAPRAGLALSKTAGDLVVEKTFAGDKLEGTEKAEFTVALAEGSTATLPTSYTISSSQTPVKIPAGSSSVTLKLKTGESAKFEDVAPGELTVSEKALEGYTTTVKATKGNQELTEVTSLPATVEVAANESTDVSVTNTKDAPTPTEEKSNLTITKKVEGTEDEKLKATEFSFKVTLTKGDQEDTNEYACEGTDRTTVKSGEAFPLKDGQTIKIKDIPVGTTYKVEEDPVTNWTPTKTGDTGDITATGATAAFTNTYKAPTPTGTGDLKITKTVSLPETEKAIQEAEAGSSTREKLEDRVKQAQGEVFTFTVSLVDADDKALKGEYEYTGTLAGKDVTGKVTDGGTISLAHNDSVTITGLPEGTKYTVTENNADNWKVDEKSKKGTISSKDASDASFTNTALGALKISKTIKSASGTELSDDLKATEFTFTVTFTKDDEPVPGEFSYIGSKTGSIESGGSVALKGGESVTFTDLPVGIKARVEETPADNWQASAKALSGETIEYAARTASFTNTYQDGSSTGTSGTSSRTTGTTGTTGTTTTRTSTPATADDTNVAVPVALGALAVGLVVAGRVVRSKE